MFKLTKKSYIVPPGNGVFTVHTAQEKKESLHNYYYQCTQAEEVKAAWKKSLNKIDEAKILLLGLTSDSGGGILRGCNWGPLYIRNKLINYLNDYQVLDLGDIKTIPHLIHDQYLNDETITKIRSIIHPKEKNEKLCVSPLSIIEDLSIELYSLYSNKKFIFLGGDHSVSYSTVIPWIKAQKDPYAIIHFDAHTDLLESRLGIDYCFGTWAHHAVQEMKKPENFIQLGIRSSGKNKEFWESKYGIQQFWSNEIKEHGITSIYDNIKKVLTKNQIQNIYISFDIDCLDFKWASATGTPEHGGLDLHHCIGLIKLIGSEFNIQCFDLVEVAPNIHHNTENNKFEREPETTLSSSKALLLAILDQL